MTLTVDAAAWNRRVDGMAARIEGLIPVVKGNGYGFGRDWLAERASLLASSMAVGTVFEVASVPSNYTALVLTPSLSVPTDLRANAILTVGSSRHVEAAAEAMQSSDHPSGSRPRRVLVKIRSSMNRYGVESARAAELIAVCRDRRLEVAGVSIHPPLHGTAEDHSREIEESIAQIDSGLPVYVSHLDEESFAGLRKRHPERTWFLRLGTSLWHGDKKELSLGADVLEVRTISSDGVAGYRGVPVPKGHRLVIIGCGTAHGIAPLEQGLSPFHFARQRMPLLEPPHMHTSMCIVPPEQPCPDVGEFVDVQRPLISTTVDVVHWA